MNEYRSGKITECILFLKAAIGQKWFTKVRTANEVLVDAWCDPGGGEFGKKESLG
jgi:hypothetical protein